MNIIEEGLALFIEKVEIVMTIEERRRRNLRCMDKWLTSLEKGKRITDYLSKYQIHRIGIYGYGMLGKHLVRELQGQNFHISWVMDKSASGDDICKNVVRPDDLDKPEDVDMAIIAAVSDVEEVEALLLKFVTGKIISVEELIDSIYVWGNQN